MNKASEETPVLLYTREERCNCKERHVDEVTIRNLTLTTCLDILEEHNIDYSKLQVLQEYHDIIIQEILLKAEGRQSYKDAVGETTKATMKIQEMIEFDEKRRDRIFQLYTQYDMFLDKLKAAPCLKQLNGELKYKESKKYITEKKEKLIEVDCPIVIAGEVGAGKSTFLNLLIGAKLLPTSLLECTAVICLLHNNNEKGFIVKNMADGKITKEKEILPDTTTSEDLQKQLMEYVDVNYGPDTKLYVDIHWPIPILKGNVVLVDTPGAGDNQEIISRVKSYLPNALAFIFIINTSNAGGVQTDRLMKLLDIANPFETPFDPRNALFICNKWDQVEEKEEKKVLDFVKNKLQKKWPAFNPNKQLFTLNALTELRRRESRIPFTEKFTKILAEIDTIISDCMELKSILHIRGLDNRLRQLYNHVTSRIRMTQFSPKEKAQKIKDIEENIFSIQQKSEDIERKFKEKAKQLGEKMSQELFQKIKSKETEACFTNWHGINLPNSEIKFEIIESFAKEVIFERLEDIQSSWIKDCMVVRINELVKDFEQQIKEIYSITTNIDCILENNSLREHRGNDANYIINRENFINLFSDREKFALFLFFPLWIPLTIAALPLVLPLTSFLFVRETMQEKKKVEIYRSNKQKFMTNMAKEILKEISKDYTDKIIQKSFLDSFYFLLHDFSKKIRTFQLSKKALIDSIQSDAREGLDIKKQFSPLKEEIENMIGLLIYIQIKFCETEVLKNESEVDFSQNNILGHGTNAIVFRGTFSYQNSYHDVAVKRVKNPLHQSTYFEQLSEVEVIHRLNHNNIVTFYGILLTDENGEEYLQLLLELCDNALEEMIFGKNRTIIPCAALDPFVHLEFSKEYHTFLKFSTDIAKGLSYMHLKDIVHRDLKLSNIMVKDDIAKITDFGTSKGKELLTNTLAGTPTHMAPEILSGDLYGSEVDIYSLGILLWEFWFGRKAFATCNFEFLRDVVEYVAVQNNRPTLALEGKRFPPEWLQGIIVSCWDSKASKRPKIDFLLKTFWNKIN